MAKQRDAKGKFIAGNDGGGRPPKKAWVDTFEKVVETQFNAIWLSDDELRVLTNLYLNKSQQISLPTLNNWKAGKLKDDKMLSRFLYIYKKALVVQKQKLFEKLVNDPDKWQRYAWIIERKFEAWNLKKIVDAKHDHTTKGKEMVNLSKYSTEDLEDALNE